MKAAIAALIVAAVVGGLGLGNVNPPSYLIEGGIPDAEPVSSMSPVEIVAEPEPVDAPEVEPEPIWDEEPVYYEPEAEWAEPEPYAANGNVDLKTAGVVSDGANTYTWYSENVLPGGGLDELNNNGRTVDERGFVIDQDGYIAIASPYDEPVGTVVETPWGSAKVYDSNPGDSYDVYTSW